MLRLSSSLLFGSLLLLGPQWGCQGKSGAPSSLSSEGGGDDAPVSGSGGVAGDGDVGPEAPAVGGMGGSPVEDEDTSYADRLPAVLWITTDEPMHPDDIDEDDVAGKLRVIIDHDGTHSAPSDFATVPADLETDITLHVRGSSSSGFEKKGYALEFQGLDDQVKLKFLGMPKESDWVLHGPYSDKTFLRNALAYWLGREIYRGADGKIEEGRWNPRTRFTELYLNEEYWGVYVVIEKPKADADRVAVDRPAATAALGDISGGYIIRREAGGDDGGSDWVSTVEQTIYEHHYPRTEDLTPEQRDYIRGYFDQFEQTMAGVNFNDSTTGYPALLDEVSWIDYFLATELSNNVDGYFKSVYFVKQADSLGGKLSLSPLWDFNIAYGNADYRNGDDTTNWVYQTQGTEWSPHVPPGETPYLTNYFKRLWADPGFLQKMYCRWTTLRAGPLGVPVIHARINQWALQLADAEERDHARWPTLGTYIWPNPVVYDTYEEEIEGLKTFLEERIAFLDSGLGALAPSAVCN